MRAVVLALQWSLVGLAACNGCRSTEGTKGSAASATAARAPTLRIVAISNLAGALEPCGCTKDQLGGIDHLAAFLSGGNTTSRSLLVAAGPTLFLDPVKDPARATQDGWKAEAISASLGDMGLSALTPGFNDWSLGSESLAALVKSARGTLLAANLEGAVPGRAKSTIRDLGGVRVGVLGVGAPRYQDALPAGVQETDPLAAARGELDELRRGGAKVMVGLVALPRGQALRLAEALPELTLLVVGKPVESGEANDAPGAPALVGKTLVVQASNHLQTVAVVDYFVRGNDFHFQDASGIDSADARASIARRIHDLEVRLAAWEKDPSIKAEDLAARRADLAKLKSEEERLARHTPPQSGSFFRYELVEIRQKLGSDPKVEERMAAYYRKVNDHNRVAFADRQPPPVASGQSGYVGIDVCSSCHEEEKKVWDRTAHARAYATLSRQFKEYNLDCVSCHVTGYEKPGGSTVTKNESLRDVQCESCHGPGQAHVRLPEKKGLIARAPNLEMCASSCHHPPHVEGFDAEHAKQLIVGPGHGMPDDAPWPAWATIDGGH